MRLSDYLTANDLSAADFARQIGATRSAVTRWLNGSRTPRPSQMREIRRVTAGQVSPADFFDAPATAA